jgi:translation initiation factor IF-1
VHRDAFQIEGIVVTACSNGTWWVELSNQHRVLAFLAGQLRRTGARPAVGGRVVLEMSPFDMSKGRIIGHSE